MSLIAIHVDPTTKKVVGVWMDVNGVPTSHYQGSDYQKQLGLSYMQSQIRGSWDDWVTRLTQQTPVTVWWEKAKAKPKETVQQAFERIANVTTNNLAIASDNSK
jgi:hypothetical protein